jgi:signal transduction histidine kinase/DNA-binding response OmpR family regulator
VVLATLAYDLTKETFDLAKGLLLCLVIILVAGAISRFTLRVLVRPLSLLRDGMTQVGQGKLEPVQVSPTGDEIEDLGNSFNQMIGALADSQEEVRQYQELLEARIKQRTEALEEAMQRATVASQAKSAFLANVSHELRTPMSGVLGMIDIVLDSRLTPEQRDQLETAQRCAHSLLALLNDILDVSKIEAGKMALESIPFDLRNLFEDCVKSHLPRARQKGIALAVEFDPLLPRQVVGDPLRMRQILANLLSNAVKFTDRGLVKAAIAGRVLAETGRVELHISVSDTGVGIPPEKLNAIFEKFTQADGSVTRRYGGTGLGLTITRMLAEMHSGKVWVESEIGKGSTFHVGLEYEVAPGGATAEAQSSAPGAAAAVTPVDDASQPGILVVEDNLVNQKVVTTLLRKKGYRVRVAAHGGEALEALGQEEFALVLMDIQMPVLDGLETTRLIRRDPKWKDVPVVAMTAHALHGDRERCLEAGMDGYISKPVQPAHLLSTIRSFLSSGARRDAAPQGAPEPRSAPIDEALAGQLLDNRPNLMKGMVNLFLDLAPERMQRLQSAARKNDAGAVIRQARELKSAAERIAAVGIARSAEEIEQDAGRADVEGIARQLASLEAEINRLVSHARPANSVAV